MTQLVSRLVLSNDPANEANTKAGTDDEQNNCSEEWTHDLQPMLVRLS